MSDENDQASDAETAGKTALEEQKAKDAEKIAAVKDAELSEDEAKAEREARAETVAAEREAFEDEQEAAQAAAIAAQEAEREKSEETRAAAEEAEKEREAAQAAARAALDAEQAKNEDARAAEEEAEKEREAAQAAAREELEAEQAERVAEREAAEEGEDKELAAIAETIEGREADEDDIGLEETTALEDLEQNWEESGVMGVYSNRVDLLNKLTSNWFSWFPPVRKFPEVNFNFIVMAGLDFLGEFKSVSGISKSLPAKKVNEGGRHHSPHYLPFDGPASRGELKLEWGSVSATSLYSWIEAVRIGWAFQRDVIVVQLARDGWPTRFMRFGNCWPTGWNGADLDTGGSSWALQSLSLVYDDFNMITVPIDLGAMSRQL